MKKNILPTVTCACLLLFAACKQTRTGNNTPVKDVVTEDTIHTAHYTQPLIPAMLTDPQQRAAYYVHHYWDGYSLADTAFIRSDDTEQLYVDFINALQYADTSEYSPALQNMMCYMETDSVAYAHFCYLSEKYLYDPNSPMRNETYYIPVLEQMVNSKRLTEQEKIRPAYRLKQACKNRPGTKAQDFSYVTPIGKNGRLSQSKSDYTLLFFYDPDCSNCRSFKETLSGIPFLTAMQEDGILRILAIYPDENKEEWLNKSHQMPQGWIVGWNKQGDIRSKQLYELRAMPTLYLLDKQKKVILKDTSLESVIQYLSAIGSRDMASRN